MNTSGHSELIEAGFNVSKSNESTYIMDDLNIPKTNVNHLGLYSCYAKHKDIPTKHWSTATVVLEFFGELSVLIGLNTMFL